MTLNPFENLQKMGLINLVQAEIAFLKLNPEIDCDDEELEWED